MASIKVRHLVKRGNSYYWQPSSKLRAQGWGSRPLSNNLEAAIAEAQKINEELDKWRLGKSDISTVPIVNSVKSLIGAYQRSNRYEELAKKTKRDYDYRLELIEQWAGNVPVDAITPAAVETFWQALARKSKYKANATIRILRLLLNYGIKPLGWLQFNPASRPNLAYIRPRDIVWETHELTESVKVADELGYFNVGTGIMLSAFLAQREGDVLSFDWSDYQNGAFLIKQHKTGAYICVPVHPILKARLDMYTNKTGLIVKSDLDGKQYTQSAFIHRFGIVRKNVCKKYPEFKRCQFLDLRRTAIVRLAEAGCTEAQISAVSGHKIDTCRRILETYLPRNSKMAKAAIDKYSNYLPAPEKAA